MSQTAEKIVALVPEIARESSEAELSKSATQIEEQAKAIIIQSDDDFAEAGNLGRYVKSHMASVTAYFKPLKDGAHKVHKGICDREGEMLRPLKNAKITLKNAMGEYTHKKEMERRRLEEEARRLAKEEADRKLAEAIKESDAGNAAASEAAMSDAVFADSMSRNVYVPSEQPKTAGVSQKVDWEIVGIDDSAVPAMFNGINIRPVDRSAVMRLIRAFKGVVKIPGVHYEERVQTSIRRF